MLAQSRQPRYIQQSNRFQPGGTMRAEIATIVDELKQSLGLLRRHL
jgi:hypothetical protein